MEMETETEKTEQNDKPDIFFECDNKAGQELTISLGEQNNQEFEFPSISGTSANENQSYKKKNNNHHVVPVGVFIVLLTIYLSMTSVQKCMVSCIANADTTKQVQQHKVDILNCLQKAENSQILERLLEYKGICKDLEIFTKDVKQKQEKEKTETEAEAKKDKNDNDILMKLEVIRGNVDTADISGIEAEEEGSTYSTSGNGDCTQSSPNKNKKLKYSIKTTNTKNGFNKYNKSTKAKYQKNQKKELNLNKKNSTAEPIIYLFALVFIYLLLKAASDINQHYKSQNKNDKRLRRCSLQSYAQTHRPDRRASKELALKQKQQHLKPLSRSLSQDQQNYHYNSHQKQQQLKKDSPQKLEKQQQQLISSTGSPICTKMSYSSNWQLLRQHTTTQSLDNSDILNSARGNADYFVSPSMMTRRCSVPIASSYQRQKITSVLPFSIVNDHANVSVSRRTSITSPSPLAMDPNASLSTELKRRVRMINRH